MDTKSVLTYTKGQTYTSEDPFTIVTHGEKEDHKKCMLTPYILHASV